MEWSCKKIDNEIEVHFGPFLKGRYQLLQEPYCHICSHLGATTDSCTWHHSLSGFDRIYAMGRYVPHPVSAEEDLLSYHIRGFKKFRNYADPIGMGLEIIAREVYKELLESTIITPVPLHAEGIIARGYNQSLELAKVIGARLDISIEEVLEKTRNVDMRALSWEERREAVQSLYSLQHNASDKVGDQKILLIDDVVTTGFTISECAKLLEQAGASSVNVLVAGRTV